MRQPSIFISHGSPMTVLQEAHDDAYVAAIAKHFSEIPHPKGIVIVSAHTNSPDGTVTISSPPGPDFKHDLVYDFGGFPKELYQVQYPAKSSSDLQGAVMGHLQIEGFKPVQIRQRLDHGVWVPMKIAYPDATIPIVHISLPFPTQPEKALRLGKALAPLRENGIMIIGSGGLVHNLSKLVWNGKNAPAVAWAKEFEAWIRERLVAKDVGSIVKFEDLAPHADIAHPTTEHFYHPARHAGRSLAFG